MLGKILGTLARLLPLPFVAWAVLRLFGLERGFPAVQLMAFTPYVAALSVVPVLLALVTRRWGAAALAAVAALSLIAVVLPRVVPDGQPAPTGPRLRVLSANLLAGNADMTALADLVRRLDVDVLALQEFTPDTEISELAKHLNHRETHPVPGVGGSAILSRYPLRGGGFRLNPHDFGQAYATAVIPGAPSIYVESVHPCAPSNRASALCWWPGLAAQPPATRTGPVRLLVGDFNATLDHVALRRVRDTGYRDAADAVGAGFAGTWGPYDGDPIPPVAIDHILVDRRVRIDAVSVHPIPGSDHRALFASLTLPRAP